MLLSVVKVFMMTGTVNSGEVFKGQQNFCRVRPLSARKVHSATERKQHELRAYSPYQLLAGSRIKFITDERFGIVLRGICFYGSGIKPYKGRVNDSLIGKGKNLCFHDVR